MKTLTFSSENITKEVSILADYYVYTPNGTAVEVFKRGWGVIFSDVDIEAIEKGVKLQPNEEMVNDLVSIVTCFSARLYGARGGRKLKQTIVQTLATLEQERGESNENNDESPSNQPNEWTKSTHR